MDKPITHELRMSGWGRRPTLTCQTYCPETLHDLSQTVSSGKHGLIARGAGRSYGDAALSSSGLILCERLNGFFELNQNTGNLRCEAAVTIADIIEICLPLGWFPAVVPGTKHVTVAGAIAADIHGKNHHKDGSFSSFVKSISVMLANGQISTCSREQNSDLFWSTIGGMGLTGIIVEAELNLKRIESKFIKVKTIPSSNLEQLCHNLESSENEYQYSVAWIDCISTGKESGRGAVILGNHAEYSFLNSEQQKNALKPEQNFSFTVPCEMPTFLLNKLSASAFNQLYYLSKKFGKQEQIQTYDSFFFPLDILNKWNLIYGSRGFIQYQCVIPSAQGHKGIAEILQKLQSKNCYSYLAVLKRFGNQEGLLSFPMPGYTLALDIPYAQDLPQTLSELDKLVIEYGGRVYLAKDAYLSAESFRAMYPQYGKWLEAKMHYDPENVFSSSLSQRLRLSSQD